MRATRRRQPKAILTAAVMILSGVGGLFLGHSPASADVDSVEGTGFGLSATVAGAALIPPTPNPTVNPPLLQANESSVDFGPHTSATLTVGGILGILANGVSVGPVSTQAGNIIGENHGGFIATDSQVANVSILADAVNIPLIHTTCLSNGSGSVGTTNVSNARLGGSQLLNGPVAPNTTIDVLGLAVVILNEQIIVNTPPAGANPGVTQITVNGAHVKIPANGGVADIILAQSFCRAIGPDVLLAPTTTAGPTTSSTTTTTSPTATTSSTSTTSTTLGATTSSTSTSTTSTTVAATTSSSSTTTTTAAVQSTGLARTGGNPIPVGALSVLAIVLGGLMLVGSGHPALARAGGPGVAVGPEKWGPAEIVKTIGAGVAVLLMGLFDMLSGRVRRG